MDRFKEPDVEKTYGTCSNCDCELYEGEVIYELDGVKLCSKDCVVEHVHAAEKVL